MEFDDRGDAGRRLAAHLRAEHGERLRAPLVLGLPRGGVPVAFEVARELHAPLDVLVARKLGAPGQPELGIGAVAEGGEPIYDAGLLDRLGLGEEQLAETVRAEREELARRVERYRGDRALPPLADHDVVLVDDGLATGVTARAAARAVRAARARTLLLAAPVGAPRSVAALAADVDEVVCLHSPESFMAVGQFYARFDQTSDETVVALLAEARQPG